MSSAVTTTSPAETFRTNAANQFRDAADMTLHELVDAYLGLTKVIEAGVIPSPPSDEWSDGDHTDEAKIAIRNRNIVNGAARARFGIGFEVHDYTF